MPENVGGPSAPYNTQIPLLAENADIQTAFRLYHYGSDTNTPSSPLPENSIARHFQDLEDFKISTNPKTILDSIDLDSLTTSGFYVQESNAFATSGSNYPSPYAGLLSVISNVSSGIVFQQYQIVGASETSSVNTINRTWWRSFFGGTWKSWRTFLESSDFASIGDDRYYTKTLADPTNFTFPAGCYICEVEVDPETGVTEVVQFVASDDFGTIINPMIVEGQVHGGIAQGIGQAMLENVVYDAAGQQLSASYMDYAMPRADDLPNYSVHHASTTCPGNPLGMKGCGEAGAIGSPPAVINAITDAIGNNNLSMPATPSAVWAALQDVSQKLAAE